MKPPGLRFCARVLALICGGLLLAPVLAAEIFLSDTHGGQIFLIALLGFGFPCGVLLNFARSGRIAWSAGWVVPVLAIVQSAAVLTALRTWPDSRFGHVVLSVAASWAVLVAVHHRVRRQTSARIA
jgi:hypothetical protein